MQRFLDPPVLAGISDLSLVAKTVVDGFVAGLHRSPDFGFSQEFAEYRAYTPGDDLRHVDWNVFARTERAYLKRYRGETNTQLTMMLDTSASMGYSSHKITKLDYCALYRGFDLLSGQPAARRGGRSRLRRRRPQLRSSFHAPGPVHAPGARHRPGRARQAHRFPKARSCTSRSF